MCQEMYKKKYNDHVKTKYMQKYNYLITHFHANRRLVLIVLIAAITDTGSKRWSGSRLQQENVYRSDEAAWR